MSGHNFSARALRVFPAGSNGEFNLPPELCTVISRGSGCRIWTADGREMLDFSMGWGSALAGHAHPAIVDAVTSHASRGTNFASITEQSLLLAETLVKISPACEQVRLCASGTEATMYCLRLAKICTGRPGILKFEGAYHGGHDVGIASTFPRADSSEEDPTSATWEGTASPDTRLLIAPFNDIEQTRRIVEENKDILAAIIVEPLQRCLAPLPGFLEALRDLTKEFGILLIFDEVVTGFRLAYGGAQEYYGVVPDLVAYGKALGGGMPIGAFGGCRELMELMSESRLNRAPYAWMASTTGGNPVSAAAALAALQVYRQGNTYPRLHELGKYLREQLRSLLESRGIEATVLGDGPLAQVAFTDAEVRDYRTSRHRDPSFARELMLALFRQGMFLNPMGTKFYLSLAHDESACDEFCANFALCLEGVLSEV